MASGSFPLKIGKIVLAVAVFCLGLYGFGRYQSESMASFCRSVPPNASPETILALAEAQGFPAFDATEARGIVIVLNQHSPYFRYAREVAFTDGHVAGTQVRAGLIPGHPPRG